MLARHAENMFWAGRHMERADDTARMLDVAFHNAVQHNPGEAAAASRRLLQVLRLDGLYDELHDTIDPDQVAAFLLSHPANPGSVTACVSAGRENLRTTRELVSTELWEAANRAHLDLRRRTTPNGQVLSPYQVIGAVRDHCQTLMGVATQTMPRDDAWYFFNLGYMLERAAMTLRLVAARESTGPETFEGWITALRSTSSLEAFQRAARGSTRPADIAGFLLFNQAHPRSVLYCMSRSETFLDELGGGHPRRRARRMLGRLRSELDFSDLDEILEAGLSDFCLQLEGGVRGVAETVAAEYFRPQQAIELGSLSAPPGVLS